MNKIDLFVTGEERVQKVCIQVYMATGLFEGMVHWTHQSLSLQHSQQLLLLRGLPPQTLEWKKASKVLQLNSRQILQR